MARLDAQEAAPLMRTSVYERLRADILSCTLRPGLQMQERELAERYEVSKSPIRDALLRLEGQQLIEVMPRKGYRVAPISVSDAQELYEMRVLLERTGVQRLVETAADPVLQGLDRFRTAPEADTMVAWVAYNRAFHVALARSCGSARLSRALIEVIEQFDRLTLVSVTQSGPLGPDRLVGEHAAIIDAIQRRDRRAAGSLMQDHVEGSRRRMLDALGQAAIVP